MFRPGRGSLQMVISKAGVSPWLPNKRFFPKASCRTARPCGPVGAPQSRAVRNRVMAGTGRQAEAAVGSPGAAGQEKKACGDTQPAIAQNQI